jgi:hypothetical protein
MPKHTSLISAVGLFVTSSAAVLATGVAMTTPVSAHEDHGRFSAGEPGDPKKPARVVEVRMFEGGGKMGFEPRESKCAEENKSVSFCTTVARRITNSSSRRLPKIANMQTS